MEDQSELTWGLGSSMHSRSKWWSNCQVVGKLLVSWCSPYCRRLITFDIVHMKVYALPSGCSRVLCACQEAITITPRASKKAPLKNMALTLGTLIPWLLQLCSWNLGSGFISILRGGSRKPQQRVHKFLPRFGSRTKEGDYNAHQWALFG